MKWAKSIPNALFLIAIIAILPLTTVSIPFVLHSNREVASFFQSLAILRDGLSSFTYITYQESSASLHLYSILSAPLLEIGYVEANRLISLFFTVIGAVAIYYIGSVLFSRGVGRLSSLFLLINPYFFPYTWAAKPEAISVGMTAVVIATLIKFTKTRDDKWFWLSLSTLCLSLSNHLWECLVAPLIDGCFSPSASGFREIRKE